MNALTQRLAAEFKRRRTVERYSRAFAAEFARHRYGKEFVESEHPRDDEGKFAAKGLGKKAAKLVDRGHVGPAFKRPVFHGSAAKGLTTVGSSAEGRSFDIPLSRLGAFFALNAKDAGTYAGSKGAVYEGSLELRKPYIMPFELFEYLEDAAHDAEGKPISQSKEDERMEELIDEAGAIRNLLEQRGHDGIIVVDENGYTTELVSFNDVPVSSREHYRRDAIPGGLGDTAKAGDFDKATLLRGLKVELEHTDNPAIALEIALDHLAEFGPAYYDELKQMEDTLNKS